MKVGLDARMIRFSGIGTTIRALLDHWGEARLRDLTLFAPPDWPNPYPCRTVGTREKVYGLAQHLGYGRRLNTAGLDLYHMPHFDVPVTYRGPLVVTIHDLIHVLFPEHSTRRFSSVYARFQIGRAVRRATRIITVSENTRRDLVRLFPRAEGKTEVLYPAASTIFRPQTPEQYGPVLARHQLSPGYLLYVGNLRASKNTARLVAAYQRARQADESLPPLVLVGQNSLREFQRGFPPPIRHLGTVQLEDLPGIYAGAGMFVFPSLYEGFGLPPLEAMACGTPVIVSNVASLPEVAGDAAVYVDPRSESSIAKAVVDLWRAPARRDELRRRGLLRATRFSWSTFADATWRIYEEVAGGRT